MKRKSIILFIIIGMLAMMIAGCSNNPEEQAGSSTSQQTGSAEVKEADNSEVSGQVGNGKSIEIMSCYAGVIEDTIGEQLQKIADEIGVTIEYSAPGDSYEELMKVRMASNNLPDIWFTHGWAVARYQEYLRPLNDQPFAETISSMVLPQVTDEDGNICSLPIDYEISGMLYNKTVLEEAGVNIDEIKTWEDFEAACEKVKAIGKTAIFLGAKENSRAGVLFNRLAPSLITNDNPENQQALLNGTFDWQTYRPVFETLDRWHEKGYINQDCTTADSMAGFQAIGSGEAAFLFDGPNGIIQAKNFAPDAQLGMFPIPAKEGSKPSVATSESMSLGVWKDCENEEAALAILNKLTEPEVVKLICSATGSPSAVTTVTVDLGNLTQEYEALSSADTLIIPSFDRVYLPSGMWNDMCVSGVTVLSQPGEAGIDAALKQMETSYLDKISQQ